MYNGGGTCKYIKDIIDHSPRNTPQELERLVVMTFKIEAGNNIRAMQHQYVYALNHETPEVTAYTGQPFGSEHFRKSHEVIKDLKDFVIDEKKYFVELALHDDIHERIISLYHRMASAQPGQPEDLSTNCAAELRTLLTHQLLIDIGSTIRAFLAAGVNPYIRLNYDGMTDLKMFDVNFEDFDYFNDSIHATMAVISKAISKLVFFPERKGMAVAAETRFKKWEAENFLEPLNEVKTIDKPIYD